MITKLVKNNYNYKKNFPQITVTSEPEVEKELAKEAQKENEKSEEKQVNGEKPPSKPVYSDSDSSDEEDERELQGRTYSEKGVEVGILFNFKA